MTVHVSALPLHETLLVAVTQRCRMMVRSGAGWTLEVAEGRDRLWPTLQLLANAEGL